MAMYARSEVVAYSVGASFDMLRMVFVYIMFSKNAAAFCVQIFRCLCSE